MRCVLETHERGACPEITEDGPPICSKHMERITREFRFRIAPHILDNYFERGEEAFVFNRKNGEVYSLNSTGTFLFRGLMAGRDFPTLLEEMGKEFSFQSLPEAIEGCRSFIQELRNLGFEEQDHGKPS